ncbi:MAG: glycosyltransferase family 39 protein [Terriglobales bacterium]
MSTVRNADPGGLEAWVIKNSSWLALAIVALAFAIRLIYANACYLNPDEALHFDTARPGNWVDVFRSSLRLAHPPLFILVLHGFLFLGRAELILRLASVLGGTAALWFTFVWIRNSVGEIPALAGLGFMALSPAAISASTEVRQYGLLLFFVCGSLYATEHIFEERSSAWMVIQGVFLLGALLTNYTVVLVLASLGIYVLLRIFLDNLSGRVLITFCASQLFLATVLVCFYLGHVRRSIPFGAGAMDYLQHYYYSSAHETRLGFLWRSLSGTFSYMAGNRLLALPFMLAFLAGLAALIAGKTKAPRTMGLLIILPFIVGFTAAAFQVFPFAGTRHQTYLLPFVAAGISAVFAILPHRWTVPLLLFGAVISPFWIRHAPPDNDPRVMPRSDMTAALNYVRQTVPKGALLFLDTDTREILEYYLERDDRSLDTLRSEAEVEEQLGGYRSIVLVESITKSIIQDPRLATTDFAPHPNESMEQVVRSARALGVPLGDPVWVFSVAWKEPPMALQLKPENDREIKEFGQISVVRFLVDQQ